MAEIQGITEITEFEIFKDFYSGSAQLIRTITNNLQADCKNDIKSERFRQSALNEYLAKNYYNCLETYTKSLCYATYNGRQYALALANRSATYFALKLYQNCINDINLSLQANYPIEKKSKLYFRKIKCLGKMGKRAEMLHEFDECSTFVTQCPEISKFRKGKVLKEIKSFVDKVEDVQVGIPLEEISFVLDQELIEPNAENKSASSAIIFKPGEGRNADVAILAARDIKRGEVLFVEKGFVSSFHHQVHFNDGIGVFYCDLCCKEARNCVPCKTCITVVYCSETCRDAGWNDYHQWECKIFRSKFIEYGFFLPLRFVVKAASDGSVNGIYNPPADLETPNLFLDIYKLPVNFHVLRLDHKATLMQACTNAAHLVEGLISSKFFDFLMSTPYYNDKNIDDLILFIGGIILKIVIQTFQRSLVVNRLSPVINLLNDNQDMFKLSNMKVKSASAFCPTISGLPHSCLSNTSISFQGDICTAKAFKNIKAGDLIYRSAYHINASCPCSDRKDLINTLALKCKCEACENIKNAYANFNTFVCHHCGGRADYSIQKGDFFMKCVDCNIQCKMLPPLQIKLIGLLDSSWFIKDDVTTLTLPETLKALTELKDLVQPYHLANYKLFNQLVWLYSKTTNVKKFLEALKNSKSCCEMRYSCDPFKYVYCLGNICDNSFQFLYNNKGKLQKQEAEEIINYFTNLIQEAKEVVSVEFPYLVNMFVPADIYLKQFKIDYLQTEGP